MNSIIDFIPLLGFLITYKLKGLIDATIVLVILSVLAVLFMYYKEKKVAKVPLISSLIVVLFGGLTILFDDPVFIKIKPTIINILFAGALLIGNYNQKPLLKLFLDKTLKMSDQAWLILSKRYAYFFFVLAIINEVIWRNFSEDFWVNFKVFGMMTISMIFIISQMPFITKHTNSTQS
ncbi:MAG: septation protein IspZ [Rickettsiales bacterium]|nr:septation protein IspZ [Rickettsiales bacterium]